MAARAKLALGLGLSLLFVVSLALYHRFHGQPRLRFPYMGTPLSEASYAELARAPRWARASLQPAPGTTLRGLVRPPLATDAPWVLFYPGNGFTQLRTGQQFLERLAGEQDFGLAVYAYRGFDSSEGEPELGALAADAPLVLERFCQTRAIRPQRVHVVGFSIGGHFAVHAVRVAARAKAPAASLTLLASVDEITMVKRTPWQRLSVGDAYRTTPLLGEVPSPVLVLQGSADEALAGAEQGRAIAKALGERARYRELVGVGHEALLSYEPALAIARQFILEHQN